MSLIRANVLRRNGDTTFAMLIATFTKDHTPHTYIGTGIYGIAIANGKCIAVSRNNNAAEWRELALTVNDRGVFSTGTHHGRSQTISMSQAEMLSWFNRIKLKSSLGNDTSAHAVPATRAIMSDAIVYNAKSEQSQFIRKGTSIVAMVQNLEKRGIPKDEHTMIMYLGNNSVHRLWKTEVITTTTLAI